MTLITSETDTVPDKYFDIAIVALGYESRCRYVWEKEEPSADLRIAVEFGFLRDGAYSTNRDYFDQAGFQIVVGVGEGAVQRLVTSVSTFDQSDEPVRVFVDVSAMSREMIANVFLALNNAFCSSQLIISTVYAPSRFAEAPTFAPIVKSEPITRALSGWSARPDQPLGLIVGLGCEEGLALGALQFLEPDKAWLFVPFGVDEQFNLASEKANRGIEEIFDTTRFAYEIQRPTVLRAKFEALLKSVDSDYRVIAIPFGPKLFAWACVSTLVFNQRHDIGIWAFSSQDRGHPADREAEGPIIWHTMLVSEREVCPI